MPQAIKFQNRECNERASNPTIHVRGIYLSNVCFYLYTSIIWRDPSSSADRPSPNFHLSKPKQRHDAMKVRVDTIIFKIKICIILLPIIMTLTAQSCVKAVLFRVNNVMMSRAANSHKNALRLFLFGTMGYPANHVCAKGLSSARSANLLSLLQVRGGSSTSDNSSKSNDIIWRRAYLGVGSNMGDQFENISNALTRLQSNGDVRLLKTSFLRKTSPMYVTDQPDFLNGAVLIETLLTPLELLRELKRVERELGRDLSSNAVKNGPRPVDLDILLFDGFEVQNEDGTAADTISDNNLVSSALKMKTDVLEIPHRGMAERDFVLAPLNDLNPNIVHPVLNKTMSDLLSSLRAKSSKTGADESVKAARVLPLLRGRMLIFNQTIFMGILNVTPDSFSDGGKYSDSVDAAASQAKQMQREGAGIIDIGGESTRPGAEEVGVEEELRRVLPVIARIREGMLGSYDMNNFSVFILRICLFLINCNIELDDIIISIDTRHSSVAKAAIDAGADIVNDVSGGTHDPQMLPCVASMGVPIILMHMRGNPKTMQLLTNYNENNGVVAGVAHDLMQRSAAAEAAGVHRWLQVLDPGIGFAKDVDGNLSLLKGADVMRKSCDNIPFLYGPSRKGFIGKITGEEDPSQRDFGTVAACLAALKHDGESSEACNILRVHNVKATKQAVMMFNAIQRAE